MFDLQMLKVIQVAIHNLSWDCGFQLFEEKNLHGGGLKFYKAMPLLLVCRGVHDLFPSDSYSFLNFRMKFRLF